MRTSSKFPLGVDLSTFEAVIAEMGRLVALGWTFAFDPDDEMITYSPPGAPRNCCVITAILLHHRGIFHEIGDYEEAARELGINVWVSCRVAEVNDSTGGDTKNHAARRAQLLAALEAGRTQYLVQQANEAAASSSTSQEKAPSGATCVFVLLQ